jgi:hypothetical protein
MLISSLFVGNQGVDLEAAMGMLRWWLFRESAGGNSGAGMPPDSRLV